MNKKGDLGDKISVIGFLFLIVVIGVGIVGGVFIFFGDGYDFRLGEAEILNGKISKCIFENGIGGDFFEVCKLNREIVEEYNIVKVCINSDNCVDEDNVAFQVGGDFNSCFFEGKKSGGWSYLCSVKSFEKDKERYDVIVGSKQVSRRIQG